MNIIAVAVGLSLWCGAVRNGVWHGSAELHTLMEVAATLLALVVGAAALVRYYSRKNNTFLFIGTGFIGTALLDGYHAAITSAFVAPHLPSQLEALIPWSWFASRLFLSMLLFLSWLSWYREHRTERVRPFGEGRIYLTVASLCLGSFAFFALVELPAGHYPNLMFPRPKEFLPGLFFLLALVGYWRKGAWREDHFEYWLVLSLVVNLVGQVAFMSSSGQLFDGMFDAAHMLKKVSYLCVLVGLLVNTFHLFRRVEESADKIATANAALKEALSAQEALGAIRDRLDPIADLDRFHRQLPGMLREEFARLGLGINGLSLQLPALREGHFVRSSAIARRGIIHAQYPLADFPWIDQAWREQRPVVVGPADWGDFKVGEGVRTIAEVPLPNGGSMGVNSLEDGAFGLAALNLIQILAGIVDSVVQKHRRTEAARLERASQQVYAAVLTMEKPEDFPGLTQAVTEQLTELGLDHGAVGINVIDDIDAEVITYTTYVTYSGDSEQRFRPSRAMQAALRECWRRGEVWERASDPKWKVEHAGGAYRPETIIDVPFAYGTLAIGLTSEVGCHDRLIEFLRELAALLDLGYRRTRDMADRRRAEEELAEENRKAGVFNEILRAGSADLDIAKIYQVFAEQVGRLCACDEVAFWLLHSEGRAYEYWWQPRYREGAGFRVETKSMEEAEEIIRHVFRGEEVLRADWNTEHRFAIPQVVYDEAGIRSDILVPVFFQRRVVGAFALNSRTVEAYSGRDLPLLRRLALQLGPMFYNARLLRELELSNERLEQSNRELEQFAYVASHDLQEPLRSVSGFLQLLQRRYGGQLDDKAIHYIARSLEGTERMKLLIQALLGLSRVTTRGGEFEAVDCGEAVAQVVADLQGALEDGGGRLHCGELPVVRGDAVQLRQLFQNLIGNALKFRAQAPPEICVGAEARGGEWCFAVADNGIGIDPRHGERIFQIFQRLHTREEYDGTGIGLALCKKIVERHGGRLWVESEPERGSTFYFTLSDNGEA